MMSAPALCQMKRLSKLAGDLLPQPFLLTRFAGSSCAFEQQKRGRCPLPLLQPLPERSFDAAISERPAPTHLHRITGGVLGSVRAVNLTLEICGQIFRPNEVDFADA